MYLFEPNCLGISVICLSWPIVSEELKQGSYPMFFFLSWSSRLNADSVLSACVCYGPNPESSKWPAVGPE